MLLTIRFTLFYLKQSPCEKKNLCVTHSGSDRLFQSMVESSTLKEGKDDNEMRL